MANTKVEENIKENDDRGNELNKNREFIKDKDNNHDHWHLKDGKNFSKVFLPQSETIPKNTQ
jgi:hypothetical protein